MKRGMIQESKRTEKSCELATHNCQGVTVCVIWISAYRPNPASLRMAELSAPPASLVLRAPEGELGWTLIELQGTIESRSGGSLDGLNFAQLVHEVR